MCEPPLGGAALGEAGVGNRRGEMQGLAARPQAGAQAALTAELEQADHDIVQEVAAADLHHAPADRRGGGEPLAGAQRRVRQRLEGLR